jgi:hypothetical protein
MSMIRDGQFRKADGSETANCVEVAGPPEGGILVRDSKDAAGPVLRFADEAWQRFVDSLKAR